jgi:hypothetical protein
MGRRVAGICYVKADGINLSIEGSVEAPASAVKRETKMSLTGAAGYDERAQRQYIKLSAINTPDFPRSTLAIMVNGTITAELANGFVYTLTGAWMEGEPTINGTDGTVDLEFSGTAGYWQ